MKTLKLLKQLKNYFGASEVLVQTQLDEAIKELEDLQNRKCANCEFWNKDCRNFPLNTTGFCTFYGIANGDFEIDMQENFCCNKWKNTKD